MHEIRPLSRLVHLAKCLQQSRETLWRCGSQRFFVAAFYF